MAESAAVAALRASVMKILTSEACGKINFSIENVTVSGLGYFYVALAMIDNSIKSSKVKISINPSLPAGTEAQYLIKSNTFVFRSAALAGDPGDGHQTIIHEATHAVIDASSSNVKVLRVVNEMAAYIAGGLYNILTGNKANDNFPVFREAHAIAETMQKNITQWNYTDNYVVQPWAFGSLRAAILASATYSGLQADPSATYGDDGVPL